MIFIEKAVCSPEKYFFGNIKKVIINYPLVWNSFLENILKRGLIKVTDDYHLLVSKDNFNKFNRKVYNQVFEIVEKSGAILKKIEYSDFVIYSVCSTKITKFFSDYDTWLYLITKNIIEEINFDYVEDNYYSSEYNCQKRMIKLIVNDIQYIIIFNDTSNLYKIDDFLKREKNLILITSKQVIDNNIRVLIYHQHYYKFREELLELLIFNY